MQERTDSRSVQSFGVAALALLSVGRGCSQTNAEATQRQTLATMAFGFAELLSAEMAVAKLSRYAVVNCAAGSP
jgi:hypothetical protein